MPKLETANLPSTEAFWPGHSVHFRTDFDRKRANVPLCCEKNVVSECKARPRKKNGVGKR